MQVRHHESENTRIRYVKSAYSEENHKAYVIIYIYTVQYHITNYIRRVTFYYTFAVALYCTTKNPGKNLIFSALPLMEHRGLNGNGRNVMHSGRRKNLPVFDLDFGKKPSP